MNTKNKIEEELSFSLILNINKAKIKKHKLDKIVKEIG
jgi:hypothetical protein